MLGSNQPSSDSDSAGEGSSMGVAKRKKYFQHYKEEWEAYNEFAGWLTKSRKGDTFASCKSCNKDINIRSGKDALVKHMKSKFHEEKLKLKRSQPSITRFTQDLSAKVKLEGDIKEGEIRMSAFVAEQNLPFTIMDHLPKLMSAVCKDSKIAQGLSCGRTKTTSIVKYVTGDEEFQKVCEDLRIHKFSLIIDESTDKATQKHLCLEVRFLTFCYLAAFNLWLILCPATLSHDWQMGSVPLVTSLSDSRNFMTCFFFGLVFLLAIRSLVDFEHLRHPPLILGLLLLVLPFLPASNLFITVGFVVAERVLYIPSLGCILLVAYGIQMLWSHCSRHRQTIFCFVVLVLVSNCLRTVIRNKDWRSRESLLRAGLQTLPHNAKMHYNYANFLRDSSRHELAKSHYYTALKLWPTYASAHNNLGTILKNNYEAEKHFLAAIRYAANHVNAHFNLGQLYRKNNKTTESEQMLKRCIHLEPNFTPAYLELARLRGPNHKTVSGLLRKVVELNPQNPYYAAKYGEWLSKKGNHLGALKFYWMSLRICATHRESAIGVFRHFRKFGQKARMFQMLTRWHNLLRKKGSNLKQDFYLQEWQLKAELSFKIKEYSTSLYRKNYSVGTIPQGGQRQNNQKKQEEKRSKWTGQKNKTINPNEKNYKAKIEILRKKRKGNNEQSNQDPKSLDFSKFALLTYC